MPYTDAHQRFAWIPRRLSAIEAAKCQSRDRTVFMGIKDDIKKRGFQLMSDPRVAKLMQNEQFLKAMMTVAQVPGKVNTFTTEQTERFAKMMRVATEQEMKDLKRQVKSLEAEVGRLRKKLDA
jgi:cell division FtsZ-interacting protein ZapD